MQAQEISQKSFSDKIKSTLFSVKGRILLLALLPMIAVFYLGAQLSLNKYSEVKEANEVMDYFAITPIVANVVHSLQEERGRSAGFLSKDSASFAELLRAIRPQTDSAIAALHASIDEANQSGKPLDYDGYLKSSITKLNQISAMRDRVNNRSASTADMASLYTGAINELIEVLEAAATHAKSSELIRRAQAYVAMVRAIETAGLERAHGSSGFSNGYFTQSSYNNFITKSSQSAAYLKYFENLATTKELEDYSNLTNSSIEMKVNDFRQKAFTTPLGNSLAGITGLEWYNASTTESLNW